ncbi:hypothetical protein [Phosphitispora sp. TUW77]|uniref:hypothetical protein n=1 Tax=Phosphitispora sp. TUW77 TaxID=3152361 RepID=UPI003AB12BA1
MDICKWLALVLPALQDRVNKDMQVVLEDFARRNTLYSSSAFFQSAFKGSDILNVELKNLLEKTSALRLWIRDLEKIKSTCVEFIETEYDSICECCQKKTSAVDARENPDFLEKYLRNKNEALALLDLYVQVQKQTIRDRRKGVFWDVIKILIGGLIGALVSRFFK